MQEGLITLKQARGAGPCADGWTKFLKALAEPAEFNPDRLFSIGDVAVSNGLDDALWYLRLLPPRLAVLAVMPTVKRASAHTTDTRVHEAINAVQRWINGDTTAAVDLWSSARAADAASRAVAGAASAAAGSAADAATWVADAADAATSAADVPSRTVADAAAMAAEREAQLQDILSLFPPYALA